jgi:hypothetical protein
MLVKKQLLDLSKISLEEAQTQSKGISVFENVLKWFSNIFDHPQKSVNLEQQQVKDLEISLQKTTLVKNYFTAVYRRIRFMKKMELTGHEWTLSNSVSFDEKFQKINLAFFKHDTHYILYLQDDFNLAQNLQQYRKFRNLLESEFDCLFQLLSIV